MYSITNLSLKALLPLYFIDFEKMPFHFRLTKNVLMTLEASF